MVAVMRTAALSTLTGMILLLSVCVASAHPGIGIVLDSKGNAYYTDLHQVWRISTDGRKTVAVPDVHTHELWIDSLDNLYGEHLWYEGDATGKWGHRVWKRTPGGAVTDVIPARAGFLDDYDDFHFVRDRSGAFYWIEGDSLIRWRRSGGTPADVGRVKFNRPGWLAATPDGRVLFVDGDDLVSLRAGGERTVVARGVTADEDGSSLPYDRHAVEGLCSTASGEIYVTVPGRRCVKKASGGALPVVDRSEFPWKASGVAVGAAGDLWVLEYSPANAVRLRHVQNDGVTRIF
jgi:hypothetical protein